MARRATDTFICKSSNNQFFPVTFSIHNSDLSRIPDSKSENVNSVQQIHTVLSVRRLVKSAEKLSNTFNCLHSVKLFTALLLKTLSSIFFAQLALIKLNIQRFAKFIYSRCPGPKLE